MPFLAAQVLIRAGIVVGMRAKARWVRIYSLLVLCLMAAFPLVLCAAVPEEPGAPSAPPAPPGDQNLETNAQEVARAFLQLQEQLRATLVAIEQNRRETRAEIRFSRTVKEDALQLFFFHWIERISGFDSRLSIPFESPISHTQ